MNSANQLLKNMANVSYVIKNDLCLGCGVCHDVCPKHCITIEHGIFNRPVINKNTCVDCGLCMRICPGKGYKIKEKSEELFSNSESEYDKYIGFINKCYATYSNEYDIRFHSASGGSVSQFLIWLLEKNIIDGAVVVGFYDKEPMRPKVYIARNREEILNARSSKYCVVSYDGIVEKIKAKSGKYVIVGLPCHIQAMRNVAQTSKTFQSRVVGYFAIYCSASKNMLSQDYFIWRYNVDRKIISRFSYRDYGCLGNMVFKDESGNDIVNKIPYLSYYSSAKGFFTPSRCMLCIDHFGEMADLCFGDIHVGEYAKDEIGINSVVSRTPYWSNLIIQCQEDGCLHVKEIDKSIVLSSQVFCQKQKKGPGVVAEFKLRKMVGRRTPNYDMDFVSPSASAKDYIKTIFRIVMRLIGKRRKLWFLIKEMDGGKEWY